MKRIVHVLLEAGLGNQMFKYAAGRSLALRLNADLVLDVTRFPRDKVFRRTYGLQRFPITGRVVDANLVERRLPLRLRTKMERVIRGSDRLRKLCGVIHEGCPDGPSIFSPPGNRTLYLDGDWQSEQYFAEHAEVIRKELLPPRPSDMPIVEDLGRIETATLPVAVCVRFYGEVPGRVIDHERILDVYRPALRSHHQQHPNATYYVFSDEPEVFSNKDRLGVPFHVVRHGSANEDKLYLLSRCTHFFLGLSSYHWWGAWLSVSPSKTVFYLPLGRGNFPMYCPKDWHILGSGN